MIRLGKISSINYEEGKARVTYEDRDQSVTAELPFLAWQYHMPKIGDLVIVACFSNGSVSGVILGTVYGAANKPYQGKEGRFRQELSNTIDEAVFSYDETNKKLILKAPFIEFDGYEYEDKPHFSVEQVNDLFSEVDDSKAMIADLQDRVTELEKKIRELGGTNE